MDIEANLQPFLMDLGIVAGLSAGYGFLFGQYQEIVTEWIIDAFDIETRFKGVTNLGMSIAIALMFSALALSRTGDWRLLPAGVLAGIIAAAEASKIHDSADVIVE